MVVLLLIVAFIIVMIPSLYSIHQLLETKKRLEEHRDVTQAKIEQVIGYAEYLAGEMDEIVTDVKTIKAEKLDPKGFLNRFKK